MYYKFNGFTQKLTGACASEAYYPQVQSARHRLVQDEWPKRPRQAVSASEARGVSSLASVRFARTSWYLFTLACSAPLALFLCSCVLAEVGLAQKLGVSLCKGQGDPGTFP